MEVCGWAGQLSQPGTLAILTTFTNNQQLFFFFNDPAPLRSSGVFYIVLSKEKRPYDVALIAKLGPRHLPGAWSGSVATLWCAQVSNNSLL